MILQRPWFLSTLINRICFKKKKPRYYTPEKDKRNLQKPVYIQIKNSNLPIIIQYLYFYYRPGITPDITKQK